MRRGVWGPEVAWPLEVSRLSREHRPARKVTLSGMSKLVILLTAALALGGAAAAARAASQPDSLAVVETAYADFNDALGAISLIESGLRDSYQGRTRSEWQRLQQQA